ncbi:putative zinc finger protein [Orchesella cincta]|uniref:Putative zinc finger protein n=1 Tax=Orchesella cincta TaxID=48709 RepID=A0A1D2N6C6_ORCCI|nr:putative zinc finger protein [Orchesella cincta]
MEAQLIEEQELLEYECADGAQIIITTTDDVITSAGNIRTLHSGAEVLQVIHDGGGVLSDTATVEVIATEEPPKAPDPVPTCDSNECPECGIKFLSAKILRQHKSLHVDEVYYACEFCSANKIHWTEMWLHQCTNTESTPIVCPQCHKTVSTKKQLQIHEEVHELQRRFTSKRMNGYFERKLQEAEDPEIDWGAKPFICGVCGKPFGKMYEVEYHEKLHTGEREPPHKCDKCGLAYINKHDLNKHIALGCSSTLARKTNEPFKRKVPDL